MWGKLPSAACYTSVAMPRTVALGVLLVLNAIVLLGQLWPEGAPPFARVVNIVVLVADVGLIAFLLRRVGWPIDPN